VTALPVGRIDLTMETTTKDDVFVTIPISVRNRVRAALDRAGEPVPKARPRRD